VARSRLLATAAVSLLLAASCGGSDEAPRGEPGDDLDDAPAATALEITVWPRGRDGARREATLECDPAGGTHPAREAACAALAAHRDALEPVPRDVACTQIYGGPARAELRGTVDGEPVTAKLSRHNGCEIARWDALEPVLAVGGR
jgi:Subtilisin inhibitor-like